MHTQKFTLAPAPRPEKPVRTVEGQAVYQASVLRILRNNINTGDRYLQAKTRRLISAFA